MLFFWLITPAGLRHSSHHSLHECKKYVCTTFFLSSFALHHKPEQWAKKKKSTSEERWRTLFFLVFFLLRCQRSIYLLSHRGIYFVLVGFSRGFSASNHSLQMRVDLSYETIFFFFFHFSIEIMAKHLQYLVPLHYGIPVSFFCQAENARKEFYLIITIIMKNSMEWKK